MRDEPKAKAGRKPKSGRRATQLALGDRGVDKHLADRARKEAAKPEDKFEADVAKAREMAVAAAEGNWRRLCSMSCAPDNQFRNGLLRSHRRCTVR
jgi:hypothetical protein